MAAQHEEHTLRSVNYRLKSTPLKQLPKILPFITTQLVTGKCRLSNNTDATWLKARASSLLQDRTQEGRWCAVILIKTILELGSPAIFYDDKDRVAAWIRGLIEIIKKPGLVTTKQCAIIAVTRAFMLTWDHQTLIRELTTPNLTAFISACLQQLPHGTAFLSTHMQSALVGPIFEAFEQLLPRHPTIFRSYSTQIQNIARAVLYNDSINSEAKFILPEKVMVLAARALVLLHQCAPKAGGAAEWESGVHDLVLRMHATMDQVFRAVIEDWQTTSTDIRSTIATGKDLPLEPQETSMDRADTIEWTGLRCGIQRLTSQFALLESYIAITGNYSIKVPVGRIVDLLSRVLQIHPYSKGHASGRSNSMIGKEEREELFALLPGVHVSALEIFLTLSRRLSSSSMPLCAQFLDLLIWLFDTESFDANIRLATYRCLTHILLTVGQALDKSTIKSLDKIIKVCATDLLPVERVAPTTEVTLISTKTSSRSSGSASDIDKVTPRIISHTALRKAAYDLLPILLSLLPAELVPQDARNAMDRTAIFISHTDALVASVLNPVPKKPSLLPLLAAISPDQPGTEALLRPRVPVISSGVQKSDLRDDDAKSEQEASDEEIVEEFEDEEIPETTTISRAWDPISLKTNRPAEIQELAAEQPTQHLEGTAAAQRLSWEDSETDTHKRGLAQSSEVVNVAKRPRLEDSMHTATNGATETPAIQPPTTAPVVEIAQVADVPEDSDDDGSDFEIPELVMKSDLGDPGSDAEDA